MTASAIVLPIFLFCAQCMVLANRRIGWHSGEWWAVSAISVLMYAVGRYL